MPTTLPQPTTLSKTQARALRQRNRLVEEHHHLVPPLAQHYARRCPEPTEDLRQVGLMGLLRAAELYRPEQGTPFAAFARPHIRGAILHHLRDVAPAVRLPRRQAERLDQLRRQEERAERGTSTKAAAALSLAAPEREVLLRQRQLCRPLPLEESLLESLSSEPEENEGLEAPGSAHALKALLERLEPRHRRVVAQVVLAGRSYRGLAQELGVSPLTVKRLLHEGLDSLRQQLEAAGFSRPGCRHPVPSAAPAC
jgi:RNA polymerase sigma-B factor